MQKMKFTPVSESILRGLEEQARLLKCIRLNLDAQNPADRLRARFYQKIQKRTELQMDIVGTKELRADFLRGSALSNKQKIKGRK